MPTRRPDLNGRRIKAAGTPHVYLVDGGYGGSKRHIPNADTYHNLFKDYDILELDASELNQIATTIPISNAAVLARPRGRTDIYLIESGGKRHIVSAAVGDAYGLDWGKVHDVPALAIDYAFTGVPVIV